MAVSQNSANLKFSGRSGEMDAPGIYLDNAATSYPKPEAVYIAQDEYFRNSANPGRGAYPLAANAARAIFEARRSIAEFLGAEHSERLIFTPGCTYSINMVLKGAKLKKGDVVVTSSMEHNAVMRPLQQLERSVGIKLLVLPYADRDVINVRFFRDSIKSLKPKLVVLSHASNVTGELIDLDAVADACLTVKAPLLVDAAQTAGRYRNCLQHEGITYWAASGHKGLFGPPGVGLLYVRTDDKLEPLIAGGTGSNSEKLEMPVVFPDRLEPGTINGPAIVALAEGVQFVRKVGADAIAEHEALLTAEFRQRLSRNRQMTIYGKTYFGSDGSLRLCESAAIVSFSLKGMSPDRVADLLDQKFHISVRAGLHCAAQAHTTLGTISTGLTRVSFGYFNTFDDLEAVGDSLDAMSKIAL
ncbi:MAG TPA: aminotransferase class V-fold PLP-dependent enzyme [Chroococcales cyanobacterium]